MIAEERGKQHHLLAERLEEALRAAPPNGDHQPAEARQGFTVVRPEYRLGELLLSESTRQAVDELVEEQQRVEVLRRTR